MTVQFNQEKHHAPKWKYLADYTPSAYQIPQINLDFQLEEKSVRVHAVCEIKTVHSGDLCLDGVMLERQMLRINGQDVPDSAFEETDSQLIIKANYLASLGASFKLETEVRIYPETNTQLEGLYQSGPILCTQCESEGFRRITYFIDRPDVLSVFSVRIEGDRKRYPCLLAGGNQSDPEDLGERHAVYWHDPFPKPSYLFALVAGDLIKVESEYTTSKGKSIPIALYVQSPFEDKTAFALECLKRAMRFDEVHYGCFYDLETFSLVAINDFNMGAMENKGLNIFNAACILANPRRSTDDEMMFIDAIIAHEYFHNWSGNRITCRDWFQLSLKEGLTVFRESQYMKAHYSPACQRLSEIAIMKNHQFVEDEGPLAHPVRPSSYAAISNFYTLTIYEKGAEVIRLLETWVGEAVFNRAVRAYFERFDGQAVCMEDLLNCVAQASGQDLSAWMAWINQPGTPIVHYDESFDSGTYRLSLTQSVREELRNKCPELFVIPVRLTLYDSKGETVARGSDQGDCLLLKEKQQTWQWEDLKEKPTPSLLQGFSAPVRVVGANKPERDLFLFAFDRDPINAYEAFVRLFSTGLMGDEPMNESNLRLFCQAWQEKLVQGLQTDLDDDLGLGAYGVRPIALGTLVARASSVGSWSDVLARYDARLDAMAQVGSDHWMALLGHFEPMHLGKQSLQAAGARAWWIQALGWQTRLAAHEKRLDEDALMDRLKHVDNMTTEFALMRLLLSSASSQNVEKALSLFLTRWQDDPILVESYFELQAGSSQITQEKLEALLLHPQFMPQNPNHIRAVVGAFARNLRVFYAQSDWSFRWLADQIVKIDAFNTQISAGLSRRLTDFHRLEGATQLRMKSALLYLQQSGVSHEIGEILHASLKVNEQEK